MGVRRTDDNPVLIPGKVLAIVDVLGRHGIKCVVGGALAAVYYMAPRLTTDIDLNVAVDGGKAEELFDVLSSIGIQPTESQRRSAFTDGQAIGIDSGNHIDLDLFFHIGEFSDFILETSRPARFADQTISIMSPEGIVACKAIFDRPKDWVDIMSIVGETTLDTRQLRRALIDIADMPDAYAHVLKVIKGALRT